MKPCHHLRDSLSPTIRCELLISNSSLIELMTTSRRKIKIAAILASTFLFCHTGSWAQQKAVSECPADSVAKAVFKGSTNMAYSLLEQADKLHDKNENLIFSPLGTANALSLLANGAKGITLDQITAALGTEDLDAEKTCGAYGKLNDYLSNAPREVNFKTAYSLWVSNQFKLKNDFAAKSRNILKAEIRNTNLGIDMTRTEINRWCEKNSIRKFSNVFTQPFGSETKFVLLNTQFFNGTWMHTFNPDVTRLMEFTNADGTKSKVMMMQQQNYYHVYTGDKLDMLRLPYIKGKFYMEIYLPHKGENLDECLKNLNKKQDLQMRKHTSKQKVNIDLPRMELKCATSLIEPLKAMDVTDAFSSEADLPGIAEGTVSVSEIRQLTFLEISERGTDAINPDDKPFDGGDITVKPFYFTVNRPFFFTIRESKSNTIIFMGKVRKL